MRFMFDRARRCRIPCAGRQPMKSHIWRPAGPGAASPGQTPPTMTSKAQLNDKSRAELEALQELPDDRIDTNDIPEVIEWTGACRGVFNRPVKQQVPRRQHVKEL